MLAMAIEVQRLRAEARSRMQRAVRLYRVRPGDTLEAIARSELGDASRAGDLGLSPQDLVPGALIRIPEAA
jgi:nucleoid-associated protein YgaU